MKKLLTIAFVLGSMIFTVPFAQAKDNSPNSFSTEVPQQIRGQNRRYQNRRNRVRTYIQTRNVRRGRYIYRETYRVTIFANGRQQTRLISRVRTRRG